jgi:peptidoglycan/xylan/chitin deacetylase (PgdA/CDA1 family)
MGRTPSSFRRWGKVPIVRLFAALALVLASTLVGVPAGADKRIALSFDDVPRDAGGLLSPDQRTRRIIAGLHSAKVRQAVFFVVPGQIGRGDGIGGERRIAAYVRAGHVIANHSWSHRQLTAVPALEYLDDIDKAHAWLRPQPGFRPWFRFPYLNEGRSDKAKRDLVRAGLAQRGLRNGYVTVDANDWHLEAMLAKAIQAGKVIDRAALRELYIETHVEAANFYDALAIKAIGRAPNHRSARLAKRTALVCAQPKIRSPFRIWRRKFTADAITPFAAEWDEKSIIRSMSGRPLASLASARSMCPKNRAGSALAGSKRR